MTQQATELIASQYISGAANARTWADILYNVKAYGAKGDGVTDDTTAINSAIAAASIIGGTIFFPPGTYKASFTINASNITLELDGAAVINGKVSIKGGGFGKSNTVSLVGGFTTFPIGTTTFSGNFAAFVPGDKVIIETTVQDELNNQVGVDFSTVVTASSTQLTIDLSTKFAYSNPNISKLSNAVYVTGSIVASDYTITGNYTSTLKVGDIVRVENRTGTGGVDASTAYFELNKVVAIDATKVTFENRFTHAFTNYWIVKLNYIKNIALTGGTINTVYCEYVTDFYVDKLEIGLNNDGESYSISLRYLYEFFIDGADIEVMGKPIGIDAVFNYNGIFSNIVASGARGATDNANIKLMSNVNVVIDTVVSTDTQSSGTQAIMPFMIDFYYTPYKCWNNKLSIDSVSATGNKNVENLSSPDFWILGVKNSSVNGVDCNNPIRISKSDSVIMSGITNNSLFIVDQSCTSLNIIGFRCGSIDIAGSDKVSFSNGLLTSKDATSSRTIYLHGTCSNIKLKNIEVNTSNFLTLYIQDTNIAYVEGITDVAGGTYSVQHGINATNIRYGTNYFNKLTPFNDAAIVPNSDYGITKGVIVPIFVMGRNSYTSKGNITGDNTAYKCAFDGDGLNFSNKNNVSDLARFTVFKEAAGNYFFTASIGLQNVGSLHTLAELYIRKNNVQNYYIDYRPISTSTAINVFLSGSVLVPLAANDYIELFVKVSGTSLTVTWALSELGGQFAGTLLYAQ